MNAVFASCKNGPRRGEAPDPGRGGSFAVGRCNCHGDGVSQRKHVLFFPTFGHDADFLSSGHKDPATKAVCSGRRTKTEAPNLFPCFWLNGNTADLLYMPGRTQPPPCLPTSIFVPKNHRYGARAKAPEPASTSAATALNFLVAQNITSSLLAARSQACKRNQC